LLEFLLFGGILQHSHENFLSILRSPPQTPFGEKAFMNLSDIRESWFPSPTESEAVPFRNAVTISNLGRERILAALMICASAILMVLD